MTVARLLDKQKGAAHLRRIKEHEARVLERRTLELVRELESERLFEAARQLVVFYRKGLRPTPEMWAQFGSAVTDSERAKNNLQAFDLKQRMQRGK